MGQTTLTNADAGRTVAANVGDSVVLSLDENPTTGYLWKIEEIDSTVLELTGDDYESGGGAIGGGGKRKLSFKAIQAGTSPMRLKCVRQWEPDNPSGTFSATVEVGA